MLRSHTLVLAFALASLAFAWPATAANLTWPGVAPCNSTLQACIDGAADNDTLYIATNAPITDDISVVNRRLRLRSADGFRPQFRNMHFNAETTSAHAGDVRMHLYGLHFDDCTVTLSHAGSGNADYEVRKVELNMSAGSGSHGIEVFANAGTVNALLYDNRVSGVPLGTGYGLISLKAWGGTLAARADYNHLTSTSPAMVDGSGIVTDYAGAGSGGTLDLHGNEVRGGFNFSGILISEGGLGGAAASVSAMLANNVVVGGGGGEGIAVAQRTGSVEAMIYGNTVTRVGTGLIHLYWAAGPDIGPLTGSIWNNVFVAASKAVSGFTGIANDYNLFNGSTPDLVPGSHTITAPAALASEEHPRPRADSPAIDAGETGRLLIPAARGIPMLDADGLHRLKKKSPALGGAAKVDIGAYEYGDRVFTHTITAGSITAGGDVTWLADPAIDSIAAANLFATSNYNAGGAAGVGNSRLFVPWWDEASRWGLVIEGLLTSMPLGAHFDILAAGARDGVFQHAATAANTSSAGTQLNHASVNGAADLFVLAARRSSLSDAAWNAHPIRVYNSFSGTQWRWFIRNSDGATVGPGTKFSVYTQERSPNAFTATATAATLDGNNNLVLDHPLLNGVACARPVLTAAGLVDVDGAYNVSYDHAAQRWTVFRYGGGGAMPLGAQFNVLVDPKQVEACNDVIFADDFE